jgi:hypothetical protein
MSKRKGEPTFFALAPSKFGKPAEDKDEGGEGSSTAKTPDFKGYLLD